MLLGIIGGDAFQAVWLASEVYLDIHPFYV